MPKQKLIGLFIFITILMSCNNQNTYENHISNKKIKNQPNILFILLDDLGKEWVSGYDADDIDTPNIDSLLKGGMKFTNVWSMPQCTPSRVTLMTGQYPFRHGWINHYDVPRWGHGVNFDSNKNPSLARILKKAGYNTCIAGKWQINDFRLQPDSMIEHGFDDYCMWTGGEGGNLKKSEKRYWDPYIHTKEGSKTYPGEFGEDIFSDFIIDFMEKNKQNPMFIYYPMCLPHGPLTTTPLEPHIKDKIDKHKAMVGYTDIILKKLVTALEKLKIRNNTIIFWTTDNGTAGNITGQINGEKIKGGKTYLTQNGVNEPFIVNWPGTISPGTNTNALIDFSDILPTFADLGGAELPKKYKYDGKSFKDLLIGKKNHSGRNWILTMGSHPAKITDGRVNNVHVYRDRALREKRYKVFVDTLKEISHIYDLENDKYERDNLIYSKSEEIIKVLKKFKSIIDSLPSRDAQPKYSKLTNSKYDIFPDQLNKQAEKRRKLSNHSRYIN
ncbi:MAG: N-acetylgalactosamine 6-sulfate sulfatase [Candidatus Pelagibacter sp. TMED153]|nr:MAG: N-acetylgalactosamine 6-sulfate sulfatase [Candidatus Pelagibacter sp. TMED153]